MKSTPDQTMGKVVVTLELTNWADEVLADRGFISAAEVRSCTVDKALVDTGASRLCLPADIIEQLGLKKTATIEAQTAMGLETLNLYEGLKLTVEGREGRYDCVELPTGQTPFLGLIPLEDLGLDPDLQNQRLRHLPTQGKDTYHLVL
ncbi:MAG: aspartyl protease family protein [Cyanobacteria bacterium J06621_11]